MLSSDKVIVRHDNGHVPDSGKSHRESNMEGHQLYEDSSLSSPDIFVELG
jgi:hypothetical protein